jgi:hypothetical protein
MTKILPQSMLEEPAPEPLSRAQALIMADAILNLLTGYARKASRARHNFYQRDLNWLADVVMRLEAGESDPLRPTGQLPVGRKGHALALRARVGICTEQREQSPADASQLFTASPVAVPASRRRVSSNSAGGT